MMTVTLLSLLAAAMTAAAAAGEAALTAGIAGEAALTATAATGGDVDGDANAVPWGPSLSHLLLLSAAAAA